jgi:hypothetical protein
LATFLGALLMVSNANYQKALDKWLQSCYCKTNKRFKRIVPWVETTLKQEVKRFMACTLKLKQLPNKPNVHNVLIKHKGE